MRPPMKSIYASRDRDETLPWEDVIIDVQGPFTISDDGCQYLLSYHCSQLRVPLLQPFKSLQRGHFGRALTSVIFRAKVMPSIIRSDRGSEMTNAVTKEILAIFGDPNHILAPAYTPRVQGMVERGHQVVSLNLSILLNEVCRAFPQEWSSLIPAVEYLYFTCLLYTSPSPRDRG